MWIRVCGVKSGRLINFIVLPLGGAMVIDPIDFMCNHHLTPTRGGMETVNRNLNGAEIFKATREDRPCLPRWTVPSYDPVLKSEGRSVRDVPCVHLPMVDLHARHSDRAMHEHGFSKAEERCFHVTPRHQGKC